MPKSDTRKTKKSTKSLRKTKLKLPIQISAVSRSTIPIIGKSELSKKIQWLIELGGTFQLIDGVLFNLCKKNKIKIEYGDSSIIIKKNMLLFSGKDLVGAPGHWSFYNNKGVKFDSYELHHQKKGSHQFCQSFALIYATSYCNKDYKKKFFDNLKEGEFANNIRVVVAFWKELFTNMFPEFTNWLIGEVKSINDTAIEYLKTSRRVSMSDYTITSDTSKIDLHLILFLLNEIDIYAEQIAINT